MVTVNVMRIEHSHRSLNRIAAALEHNRGQWKPPPTSLLELVYSAELALLGSFV